MVIIINKFKKKQLLWMEGYMVIDDRISFIQFQQNYVRSELILPWTHSHPFQCRKIHRIRFLTTIHHRHISRYLIYGTLLFFFFLLFKILSLKKTIVLKNITDFDFEINLYLLIMIFKWIFIRNYGFVNFSNCFVIKWLYSTCSFKWLF